MCLFRKKKGDRQSSHDEWHNQWQSAFPPECRDVPVTHDGVTYVAYVLVGHTVMMLQDGLLMEATFFDVCEHFQRAGYHVVWLMRCTRISATDTSNGNTPTAAARTGCGRSRRRISDAGVRISSTPRSSCRSRNCPPAIRRTAPKRFCSAWSGRRATIRKRWFPRARRSSPPMCRTPRPN